MLLFVVVVLPVFEFSGIAGSVIGTSTGLPMFVVVLAPVGFIVILPLSMILDPSFLFVIVVTPVTLFTVVVTGPCVDVVDCTIPPSLVVVVVVPVALSVVVVTPVPGILMPNGPLISARSEVRVFAPEPVSAGPIPILPLVPPFEPEVGDTGSEPPEAVFPAGPVPILTLVAPFEPEGGETGSEPPEPVFPAGPIAFLPLVPLVELVPVRILLDPAFPIFPVPDSLMFPLFAFSLFVPSAFRVENLPDPDLLVAISPLPELPFPLPTFRLLKRLSTKRRPVPSLLFMPMPRVPLLEVPLLEEVPL